MEKEKRYNTLDEVPEWGKETVKKLLNNGALQGSETGLNLSEDMLRVFVVNDRMKLYD